MAKVPTARSQRIGTRVSEASQTPFQSASTNIDMFGGAQARQMSQMGKALSGVAAEMQQEADRQQALNDAVLRQKVFGEFEQEMSRLENEAQTMSDISDPGTVSQFQANAQQMAEQYVQNHSQAGSQDSVARLQIGLSRRLNDGVSSVVKASQDAKRQVVLDSINDDFVEVSDAVLGGMSIKDAEAMVDDSVQINASALTAEEEQNLRDSGRAKIYADLFNYHMSGGGTYKRNVQAAEDLLNAPGVREVMGDKSFRKMAASVFAAKREEMAGSLAGQKALEKAAYILGTTVANLSPTARRKIAGLYQRPTAAQENLAAMRGLVPDMSEADQALVLAGKIPLSIQKASIESAINRRMTESEERKFFDITPDPTFGQGQEGKARAIVADNMDLFANGYLDPREERRFGMAVAALAKPVTNPNTKRTTYKIPAGAEIRRAFAMRGIDLDEFLNESKAQPQQASDTGTAIEEDYTGPTMYGSASEVTGVGAAVERGIRSIPIGLISGSVSGKSTQMVALNKQRTADLVTTLQRNPRYSEGERERIRQDLDIDPGAITSEDSYKDKLRAVDANLRERLKQALQTLENRDSTKQDVDWAMQAVPAIRNFLQRLGAPITVTTEEEANKLPPGTTFIGPDGNEYTTPERGSSSGKK